MAAENNASVGGGGVLRFLPPFSVDEYIRRWSGRLETRRLSILQTRSTLTDAIAWAEHDTSYAGWRLR